MNGKLIVIEGLDGSGKSTQLNLLKQKLMAHGYKCTQIKLPDYDSRSSELVKMYLGGEFGSNPDDVNAYAASAFYAVDRVANYICKWKKQYIGGELIVADRYTTSNAYHQMQKLSPDEWDEFLLWLEDFEYVKIGIPMPQLTVYLDMPTDVSQRLMTSRYNGDENKKDIHEVNVAYLESCRVAAAYAAQKLGWKTVCCAKNGEALPVEEIGDAIYEYVKEIL